MKYGSSSIQLSEFFRYYQYFLAIIFGSRGFYGIQLHSLIIPVLYLVTYSIYRRLDQNLSKPIISCYESLIGKTTLSEKLLSCHKNEPISLKVQIDGK